MRMPAAADQRPVPALAALPPDGRVRDYAVLAERADELLLAWWEWPAPPPSARALRGSWPAFRSERAARSAGWQWARVASTGGM